MIMAFNYSEKMDTIFNNGLSWEHRSLRTLFDPSSGEWNLTTLSEKGEILNKVAKSGVSLNTVLQDYKKENRTVETDGTPNHILAMAIIVDHMDPDRSFKWVSLLNERRRSERAKRYSEEKTIIESFLRLGACGCCNALGTEQKVSIRNSWG